MHQRRFWACMLILVAFVTIAAHCPASANGPAVLQGPPGPPGPAGAQGPPGPPGELPRVLFGLIVGSLVASIAALAVSLAISAAALRRLTAQSNANDGRDG